jgi:hypothetical protein
VLVVVVVAAGTATVTAHVQDHQEGELWGVLYLVASYGASIKQGGAATAAAALFRLGSAEVGHHNAGISDSTARSMGTLHVSLWHDDH